MQREFTGRDLFMIMVAGFGIVIAVNFYMATQAASIFSGVVVENSYHASQKFNRWLAAAEQGQKLGWQAQIHRADNGALQVATHNVPEGAVVEGQLRRPLGDMQRQNLEFIRIDQANFQSTTHIGTGRWIARIKISTDQGSWSFEGKIQ